MTDADPIPPATEADLAIDLYKWHYWPVSEMPPESFIPAVVRRCHAAEQQLARIRERLAPLLAGETVECPECRGNGWYITDFSVQPWVTKMCRCGTGRIPLDVGNLTVEEIVERVAKRIATLEAGSLLVLSPSVAQQRVEQLEKELEQLRSKT